MSALLGVNQKMNLRTTTSKTINTKEETIIKEELRQLKNNFERLESLFQDSLEEVNQVKSEYEAKLIEANDRFRTVKAENEELKEKVDVLFKLGRSYINRKENPPKTNNENLDEITIDESITIEDVTEDDLQTWTKNKLRGFRRVSPTIPAATSTKHAALESKTTAKK